MDDIIKNILIISMRQNIVAVFGKRQWLGNMLSICLKFFKVNNRNTRTMFEICSKLTIKTLERRQWRRSGVFIINFEQISHIVLLFLSLTFNK